VVAVSFAGDIVAAIGLKQVSTGDTLCDAAAPIILESLTFSEPVIHMSIEPKTHDDQERMSLALGALIEEDPTLHVRSDPATGQTILSGMGELHLEINVERMVREYGVAVNVGSPQVAYRETIRTTVEGVEELYKRQTGGKGQYAHVIITLEPLGPGGGFEFVDETTSGVIAKEFINPINQGIREKLTNGVLAGYPMVDVRVRLLGGSVHDVDSSEMAFKIAGSRAVEKAAARAHAVLLEPIMAVDVLTPSASLGDVLSDIASRRGRTLGTETQGSKQIVRAHVPLSELFGYSTDLRSKTQGRASYTMTLFGYAEVPAALAHAVIAGRRA
jgi:elongation factor G